MSEPDDLEDVRLDYEHLTHLLSDYENGAVSTADEEIEALRLEIVELEAILTTTIQMPLLDEGTEVWRPVDAFYIAPGVYRIEGRIPDGEVWAFSPGAWVRCEQRQFGDGETRLTAVSKAA